MARLPALPPNQRFFARIDSFTCECPRCGQILQARYDRAISEVRRREAKQVRPTGSKGQRKGQNQRLTYNPLSSRLTCGKCGRVFGVGLLVYPVHQRATGRQPEDTRPTYQQILAIRRLGGGFLVLNRKHRGEESVNIFVTVPCFCIPNGWTSDCPVHGWDQAALQTRLPTQGPDQDPE